jgi:hypothetical protein
MHSKCIAFPHVAETLVGIEALNSGLVYIQRNPMVAAIAQTLPLARWATVMHTSFP